MAARTGRPARDQRLAVAKRTLADINISIGRHVTMCYRCSSARGDTARLCDTSWELAKAQARAQAEVRHADDAIRLRPVQGSLW